MSLASDLSAAVKAGPREHQELVDAALCVGQWLADRDGNPGRVPKPSRDAALPAKPAGSARGQGLPGRWDRVRPVEVLRGLDFLSRSERERFLFSLVGLLGHAALMARIPPAAAKQSIDEAAVLSGDETVRAFARATSAQLGAMLAS